MFCIFLYKTLGVKTYYFVTMLGIWILENCHNFFVFFFQELKVLCASLCSTIFVERRSQIWLLFIGSIEIIYKIGLGFGF
jgi:hypothetical protein